MEQNNQAQNNQKTPARQDPTKEAKPAQQTTDPMSAVERGKPSTSATILNALLPSLLNSPSLSLENSHPQQNQQEIKQVGWASRFLPLPKLLSAAKEQLSLDIDVSFILLSLLLAQELAFNNPRPWSIVLLAAIAVALVRYCDFFTEVFTPKTLLIALGFVAGGVFSLQQTLPNSQAMAELNLLCARHASVTTQGPAAVASPKERKCRLAVLGKVLQKPHPTLAGALRFVLQLEQTEPASAHTAGLKLLLNTPDLPWNKGKDLLPGDVVRLFVEVRILGQKNDNSYFRQQYRNGIAAVGEVLDEIAWRHQTKNFREQTTVSHLLAQYPGEEAIHLLAAMLLGRMEVLSENSRQLFRELGISHVLVVSGFHVTILYGLAVYLARCALTRSVWLIQRVSAAVLASVFGVLLCGAFVLEVPQQPPVIRAFVLLLGVAGAEIWSRRMWRVRLLLLSAAVISLFWPGVICDLSFQLTYLAVIGLAVGDIWHKYLLSRSELPVERQYLPVWTRLQNAVRKSFFLSLGAWFFTLPITLRFFHEFAPLAPLVNLVAVPILTLVFFYYGGVCLLLFAVGSSYSAKLLQHFIKLANCLIEVLWQLRGVLNEYSVGYVTLSPERAEQISNLLFAAILLTMLCANLAQQKLSQSKKY